MTRQTQSVRVGKAHRIVLPPQVRAALDVREGDSLVFQVEGGEVRVQSMRAFTEAIQAKYAGRLEGALEELFAERRAEAERE